MKDLKNKRIHIAVIGTRGIPANYGGFETFAEELSARLVTRGNKVNVYCRKGNINWQEQYYKGVRLIILPTLKNKYFDTIAHTFFCVFHVIFTNVDIVYFCNAINSVFVIIPRIFGQKTIINVDGLEWKRRKWNRLGKLAYRISEKIATIFADKIVTDSKAMQAYYRDKFSIDTVFIPYGASLQDCSGSGELLKKHGLKRRGYVLYVSRLEPENNAHIVVKAYERVKGDIPLIIVGDAPYSKEYISNLKSTSDKRIKFLGSIYGNGYSELLCNAFVYIHGNEVGGTNPALLDAMVSGNCVIANGVEFNKEVIDNCGLCFEHNNLDDLKSKIEYLFDNPEKIEKYRLLAVERIKKHYNWDDVVDKTEDLIKKMLNKNC